MLPSILSAADLAQARKIFQERRSRVEALFDSSFFLMLGYVDRTSTLEVDVVVDGKDQEYRLPDSRGRENHSSNCKARLLHFAGLKGSIADPKSHARWSAPATELLGNGDFRAFLDTHGGFWCDVALADESNTENSVDEFFLIPGGSQEPDHQSVDYLQKYLRLPGVDTLSIDHPRDSAEVRSFFETVLNLMDPCCHFAKRACILCGLDFLPTGWTALELRVGYEICPMCCHVATDWRQAYIWLQPDKPAREQEIEVGLRIGQKANQILPRATDAPQWDSLEAIKTAKLETLASELAEQVFLCVALRPKLSQIRKDYESWEAWVHQLGGNFAETYSLRQRIIVASDGHICFSKGEAQICEFLTNKKIAHTKEPLYADLAGRNEALVRHFVGDFRVDDVIIEYSGLAGAQKYDERLATKVSWASQLGIKVIVVSPEQLDNLEGLLHF